MCYVMQVSCWIVSHVLCYVSVMLDSLSCVMLCKCNVG